MKSKRKKFWRGHNRFRLMLTLELAVLLPTAALIYLNFHNIDSIKRNKKVETLIHSDFQYVLAVSEKKINEKIYSMTEEVRDLFPSPNTDTDSEKERKLDLILARSPWLAHVLLFDAEKGLLFRSQPQQMDDKDFREEHERLTAVYRGLFSVEGKMLMEELRKKTRLINCYGGPAKRAGGYAYITTAFFALPQLSQDRLVFGGASFDPYYLKRSFFPEMLDELITQKLSEDKGDPLAMMVYLIDHESGPEEQALATSAGWGKGKPEVSRKLDDVFRGLALGIKFQGTTVEAIGRLSLSKILSPFQYLHLTSGTQLLIIAN